MNKMFVNYSVFIRGTSKAFFRAKVLIVRSCKEQLSEFTDKGLTSKFPWIPIKLGIPSLFDYNIQPFYLCLCFTFA